MIDTHSHLYMPEDFPGQEGLEAVDRAIKAGVEHMILPGVDRESIAPMIGMHKARPDNTSLALGLHPTEVREDWCQELDEIFSYFDSGRVVAVGEVGIDLHEDTTWRQEQREAFELQLRIAHEMNLPAIIHQRDALDDTLDVLNAARKGEYLPPGIVFHCFTGTESDARRIMDEVPEAFFGIGGVATFKNARDVRDAVKAIGINRLVLETDAPWLAPVPWRGRRNESAYIPHIAASVADTLGISSTEVAKTTDSNVRAIFGI